MRFFFALILLYWSPWALSVEAIDTCTPKLVPAFTSSHLFPNNTVRGHHEGHVYQLKRKYSAKGDLLPWKINSRGDDKPGDFRWATLYMNPSLKEYFSIESYNKDYKPTPAILWSDDRTVFITIPDFDEANGGLLKFKEHLKSEGRPHNILTFYKTKKVESALAFFTRLAEEEALPMGENGELFEHDFNYHFLSSLLTPPAVVALMSKRAKVILQFLEYAKTHTPKYSALRRFPELFENVTLQFGAKAFDFQGNLWMDYHSINEASNRQSMPFNLGNMFFNAYSAREYLKNMIQMSRINPIFWNAFVFPEQVEQLIQQFCKDSAPDVCREDIPKDWLKQDPNNAYVNLVSSHYWAWIQFSMHQVQQFKHRIDGR